ncbi:MAG: sugar ABC transporter ATP-binding protein [Thermomicrobiales bacterium]
MTEQPPITLSPHDPITLHPPHDPITPSPIVEFHNVSKRFGGVRALQDVSFAVPAGEIHALVGENGSGKSTLIRICGGVFPPDEGTMRFEEQEVAFADPLASRAAGISVVHQEIPMCPDLTAGQNVLLGYDLPKRGGLIDWGEVNRRAAAVFSDLGVDIPPGVLAGALPIAQRQLVAIAQALSFQAKLLILDEPTSALSKQEAERLFAILRGLKARGITIIYVSHRLEEVFGIADRISALRDGRYVGTVPRDEATPDQIVRMMVGREFSQLFPKEDHVTDDVLLSVRNLSAPGAFADVSFDLHRGEVLGLVGLQGSGTSEVLRALAGQVPRVSGEILLEGEAIHPTSAAEAIRRRLAYVPADRQGEGLFAPMSVRENAGLLLLSKLATALGWVPSRSLDVAVREMVSRFQIRTASLVAPVSSLSGGNQQKVVIARSLSRGPLVILLDDPTRGIDVGAKAEVHQILNGMTRQGRGVLLVSSELPEVLAMSDRVLAMYGGRVVAELAHGADHEAVMGVITGVSAA